MLHKNWPADESNVVFMIDFIVRKFLLIIASEHYRYGENTEEAQSW